MTNQPYYLTTSILYPNANPHMGHALELVQADFLARYHRQFTDRKVHFQTGLDEHGLKIQRAASKAGKEPKQFVDDMTGVFEGLAQDLHVSYDRFIRTTEPGHYAMSQAIWKACAASGDIYKKTYRAWYNVKQEEFLGLANEHPDPSVFGVDQQFIELIEEENYFFALSKYASQVVALLKTGQYKIVPENRAQELINFIESRGLQDVSISREKNKLSWGVPVPDDESQVMYVWFDALTNYLTGVATVNSEGKIVPGEFWPPEVHCVGKDISRFHGALWPAMLLSAGLPLPKTLLVHGFILSEGKAMSKSLGNVIDPQEMIRDFGSDALRWYLLTQIPTTGDGDFTRARLSEVYSSNLANDFGNLVSRVLSMTHKYFEGRVPELSADQVNASKPEFMEKSWETYHQEIEKFQINEGLKVAQEMMVYSNRRIDEQKPWVLAKDPQAAQQLAQLLYELLEIIRHISLMVEPALPSATDEICEHVFPNLRDADYKERANTWGVLKPGSELGSGPVMLFPRIEEHD